MTLSQGTIRTAAEMKEILGHKLEPKWVIVYLRGEPDRMFKKEGDGTWYEFPSEPTERVPRHERHRD